MIGESHDLAALTDGKEAAGSGIPHAEVLVPFAEAVALRDAAALPVARQRLLEAMGGEALVDAAAVAGNFMRMVRIADGTGIPLDAPVAALSADIRDELGLDAYGAAAYTGAPSGVARTLARGAHGAFRLVGRARALLGR